MVFPGGGSVGKGIPVTFPRRGDVYLVDLEHTRGAEIQKQRPAVVIQNDVGNRYSAVTIVAALSSSVPDKPFPFIVRIESSEGGLEHDSVVLLNQVRTIDKSRLLRRLGKLKPATMARVDRALQISLGLIAV